MLRRRRRETTVRDHADVDVFVVEGTEVAVFSDVVARLRDAYPDVPVTRLESILLREWEAYAAGRPLVVPVAVEDGVREILDGR